ncbi:family 20 glycosylhydrolase [Catenulispora sp. NL8]|uniref:Family 20 glycosylhydrolase n=1 Tax=Catenulispora pinistramenti TaxID=2705254 RepID=A0ABS5L0V0_9ACTN|nr:family 20 glycosylhydrolase [Catenulispora pinistramenti]MBS2551884.1 family 20 glycosylhydrolase [Catenulispora pinistramenti]
MRSLRMLPAAALIAAVIPVSAVVAPHTAQAATHVAAAASGPPQTIPAVRTWTAATGSGSGSYAWTAASRVVIDPAYAGQLQGDANTFATDLSALEGRVVGVAQGQAGPGDIALTLGGHQPTEGYTMTVGSSVSIQGSTTTGEFWGTRTVLQLLHQGPTIAAGTATDSPDKSERGLMLDTGRRFFDVAFVENQIREMSYLKMNYLHLHLSDTYGFRLESDTHPEITSPQHYSKQDIKDIIALANQYHVTVVPEIDMPGHMDAILSAELGIGHDYRLKDSSGNASSSYIDLTIPGARQLISDLINEYEPLFTNSPYWHLGADEYVTDYSSYPQLLTYAQQNYGATATAKDTFYGFVNWADGIVRAGGKTMRMWNDGLKSGDGTIAVNPDIIVEYWSNTGLSPQQVIDAGHTIANEAYTPTYYVYGGPKPDTTWMYESWNPDLFDGSATITNDAANLGSLIHVWCDSPGAETEDQTAEGIKYPMRDLAQMTWNTPKLVPTYAAFVPIMDAVGRDPLYPKPTIAGDLAQGKPTTASSIETPDFPAANATDADLSTRWSSQYVDPTWLQVDLGSVQTVNRVVLAWETAYGKDYQIQLSNDGTNWTTVYTRANGTGGTETLTFPNATGRYLRMYGTARGTQYGYSLWEFEAFNDANSGVRGTHTVTTGSQALDDPASSTATGTQLITWGLQGGKNQQWTFTEQADGSYQLTNGVSGLCVDVTGSSSAAGAAVIQWTCTGNANQHWNVTALAGGGYTIASANSGLLLTTASTANNALVTQENNSGSALQHWSIS